MSGETLATLIARMNRVNANIQGLERRIQAFVDEEHTYRVVAQQDPKTGQVIVLGQALADPPVAEWTPFISEIVHGIRSTLDNLVWGLSVKYQRRFRNRPPSGPIPYGSPWRQCFFPIATKSGGWPPKALDLVDPAVIPVIEKVQPFHTGQHRPDREPLAIVQELWNIDKHRHAPIVRMFVGGKDTKLRLHLPPPMHAAVYREDRVSAPRILDTEAPVELARLTVLGVSHPVEVEVEHHLPFEIALKRRYPGQGKPLLDVLEGAQNIALFLVAQLQSHLPKRL